MLWYGGNVAVEPAVALVSVVKWADATTVEHPDTDIMFSALKRPIKMLTKGTVDTKYIYGNKIDWIIFTRSIKHYKLKRKHH